MLCTRSPLDLNNTFVSERRPAFREVGMGSCQAGLAEAHPSTALGSDVVDPQDFQMEN